MVYDQEIELFFDKLIHRWKKRFYGRSELKYPSNKPRFGIFEVFGDFDVFLWRTLSLKTFLILAKCSENVSTFLDGSFLF